MNYEKKKKTTGMNNNPHLKSLNTKNTRAFSNGNAGRGLGQAH
jgi:hypothetical protein